MPGRPREARAKRGVNRAAETARRKSWNARVSGASRGAPALACVPMSRPLVLGLRSARWLALILIALACATPAPPRVSPRVVRVATVSPDGIALDVQLGVHNPNSFSIAAKAVSGTLYVAGTQRLGRGEAQLEQPIGAGADAIVSSRVHVAWADLSALLPLLGEERVPYDFRGEVTLGGESLHLTLPFSLAGELTRAELIQAGLRGL